MVHSHLVATFGIELYVVLYVCKICMYVDLAYVLYLQVSLPMLCFSPSPPCILLTRSLRQCLLHSGQVI